MLLYPFSLPVTLFPRTFIIKGDAVNGRNPPSCRFTAFMTLFPVTAFIKEESKGCINQEVISAFNETAVDAIISSRNSP